MTARDVSGDRTSQGEVNSYYFLVGTGGIIVTGNSLSLLALKVRQPRILASPPPKPAERRAAPRLASVAEASGETLGIGGPRAPGGRFAALAGLLRAATCSDGRRLASCGTALGAALGEATVSCLLLAAGYMVHLDAMFYRHQSAFNTSLDAATRIEYRAQHDVTHGTWHVMMACFLLTSTLSVLHSLAHHAPEDKVCFASERANSQWAGREETLAKLGLVALAVGVGVLHAAAASVRTWLVCWCAVLTQYRPS